MPPPAPNRYHSTRLAHRDETAEDYVEAIAQLTALHGQTRVKHLAVITSCGHALRELDRPCRRAN
jgi:hypothetical protein